MRLSFSDLPTYYNIMVGSIGNTNKIIAADLGKCVDYCWGELGIVIVHTMKWILKSGEAELNKRIFK